MIDFTVNLVERYRKKIIPVRVQPCVSVDWPSARRAVLSSSVSDTVVGQCLQAGGGRARPVRASGMEAGPAARRASEMEAGRGGGLRGRGGGRGAAGVRDGG